MKGLDSPKPEDDDTCVQQLNPSRHLHQMGKVVTTCTSCQIRRGTEAHKVHTAVGRSTAGPVSCSTLPQTGMASLVSLLVIRVCISTVFCARQTCTPVCQQSRESPMSTLQRSQSVKHHPCHVFRSCPILPCACCRMWSPMPFCCNASSSRLRDQLTPRPGFRHHTANHSRAPVQLQGEFCGSLPAVNIHKRVF